MNRRPGPAILFVAAFWVAFVAAARGRWLITVAAFGLAIGAAVWYIVTEGD